MKSYIVLGNAVATKENKYKIHSMAKDLVCIA
jgi:hypothetical protein